MLPLELLKVIVESLSRDDLDVLMLVNTAFRDLATRDFAEGPFRYFTALDVSHPWIGRCKYEFVFFLADGSWHTCTNHVNFVRRMRLARVGKNALGRSLRIDDVLINVLLPHKEAWHNGSAEVQSAISTIKPSHYERLFSELLFCKRLDLLVRGNDRLSRPLMSLPALRECRNVHIRDSSVRLEVNEILEWLAEDVCPNEPTTLTLWGDRFVVGGLSKLLTALKTDFARATKAYSYHVVLYVTPFDGNYDYNVVNKATSETLKIRRDPAYIARWRIDALRKPKQD